MVGKTRHRSSRAKEIVVLSAGTIVDCGSAAELSIRLDMDIYVLREHIYRADDFFCKGLPCRAEYTGKLAGGSQKRGRPAGSRLLKEKPRRKLRTIGQVVAEAKAAGMSYGQYVALTEGGK